MGGLRVQPSHRSFCGVRTQRGVILREENLRFFLSRSPFPFFYEKGM